MAVMSELDPGPASEGKARYSPSLEVRSAAYTAERKAL